MVDPKNVAVAPNETNTIEKPIVKSRVSFKIKYFYSNIKNRRINIKRRRKFKFIFVK